MFSPFWLFLVGETSLPSAGRLCLVGEVFFPPTEDCSSWVRRSALWLGDFGRVWGILSSDWYTFPCGRGVHPSNWESFPCGEGILLSNCKLSFRDRHSHLHLRDLSRDIVTFHQKAVSSGWNLDGPHGFGVHLWLCGWAMSGWSTCEYWLKPA